MKAPKALLLAGLLMLALFPGTVQAGNGPGAGTLQLACKPMTHTRQADPIVSPGVFPSAHLHDFYGNVSTDEFSTEASLLAAAGTCNNTQTLQADGTTKNVLEPGNHSAYWVPSLYFNGVAKPAPQLTVYYSNSPGNVPTETMPQGLKLLGGDSHATAAQSLAVIRWSCFGFPQNGAPEMNHPFDCTPYKSPGSKPGRVQVAIRFPFCWDGVGMEPSDTAYGLLGTSGTFTKTCPAGFPHELPRLRIVVESTITNPINPDGSIGLSWASGPWYSIHGDAFEAWEQAVVDRLLCVDAVRAC